MNKSHLLEQIIISLEAVYKNAVDATKLAHEAATHGETKAESKYDTFGLEASYLAHGQAQRVAECEADLVIYKKLVACDFTELTPISLGALIYLKETGYNEKIFFLGSVAGGLKLVFCNENIMVITTSAPLGKALAGKLVGEEVKIFAGGEEKLYEITTVK